jgi:catechol 2,3-dioxygenase-like lactoylglutathione lyase family enzyme
LAVDFTHHTGLLVADIDRAAEFYMEAFGGRWLMRPVTLDGESSEIVMGGPPGTAFRLCLIALPKGCIELFQFVGDALPDWVSAPKGSAVPHVGILVDDTDAALERVEAAGGRRCWDDVMQWGEGRVVYVEDLDRNVLELIDVTVETVVKGMLENFPDAAP